MTHNCRKLEKYLFPGIYGCIFDPCTSSYPEGSEYVWQRGVGCQKCLVMGGFWAVLFLQRGTDWKLPTTRHFWLPTPLCHTYSEPSGHEDSLGLPVHGAKMHPEMPGNVYFSGVGQLWIIQVLNVLNYSLPWVCCAFGNVFVHNKLLLQWAKRADYITTAILVLVSHKI